MTDKETRGHAPQIEGATTPEVKEQAARATTAETPAGTGRRGVRAPRIAGATPELAHRMAPATPTASRPAQSARDVSSPRSGLEATRRAWLRALDAYEGSVLTYADFEDRVADRAQLPWVAQVVRAQAELRRRALRASTQPARSLLER